MKYLFLFIFALIVLSAQGQLRSKLMDSISLDTIHIFEPQGAIYFCSEDGDKISEALTLSFVDMLKVEMEKYFAPRKIQYYSVEGKIDSLYLTSFYNKLGTIKNYNQETFDTLTVPSEAISLLRGKEGRYIAVAFVSGYAQRNYTLKVIRGLSLVIVTALLTFGSYYYMDFPAESFSEITLVIIDKEQKKYLYYGKHSVIGEPLEPATMYNLVSTVRKKLFPKKKVIDLGF